MRVKTAMRLDPTEVERARRRACLPSGVAASAVVRYALAMLAGTDTATALDCTSGKGSLTYRRRAAA
jgi:hypothetical protein